MDDKTKIKNLRARVDELWAISQTVSATLIDEQSRCARLQAELSAAVNEVHSLQKKLLASELKQAEALAVLPEAK